MELISEKVEHTKFGLGTIVDLEQNKVSVEFSNQFGKKSFIFPDAFEQFLKLNNPIAEEDVMEQVRLKKEQVELEKGRKILAIMEEEEERKKEKLELAKQKKKLAKKPVTKKPATKKVEGDD